MLVATVAGCSEVELVDVLLREGEGFTEEDVVALDLDGAELARGERFGAGLEGAIRDGDGGLDREVAEVLGLPEHDGVGHAFLHVAAVLARETEADDLHLARLAGLLDRLGGAGDGG